MIRVSEEARRLLGAVRAPEGEVLRLVLSPSAGGPGGLALRHGRGEGADQVVQHAGGQVLRIDLPVRKAFDGASVEVVGGTLSVVPPGSPSADDGSPVDAVRPSGPRIAAPRPPRAEEWPSTPRG